MTPTRTLRNLAILVLVPVGLVGLYLAVFLSWRTPVETKVFLGVGGLISIVLAVWVLRVSRRRRTST